jgi:putative oxidoreductase
MNLLALSPLHRLAWLAPLVLRAVAGIIMAAHGWQKLTQVGPATFGGFLAELGVPLPVLMGYLVTLTELVGGVLLIAGLLTRIAALALTVDLAVAILLVKVDVGLIARQGQGAGAELDLALIAGFVALVLLGPGRLSLDHALGLERPPADGKGSRPARLERPAA